MPIRTRQQTLRAPISCYGIGVHSGKNATLTLKPAPENHGIRFFRTDLPGTQGIPALFSRVVDTSLATVIGENGVIVSTIEHLMAAFAGMGIDNARVELDNYEMPIMDGSAIVFADKIRETGIIAQSAPCSHFIVTHPIEIADGDKFVGAYPDNSFRITCTIEFPNPIIGRQTISIDLGGDHFFSEIAPARTFGFLHEVEMMKQLGLGRGGSLETAVVVSGEEVINEGGLRFPDEFVRHKLLDCIGDFSLIGMPIRGHIKTVKSGHLFNHHFITEFFKNRSCWETVTPT
ncbi:UDP-3-O-acyl-N-acetylglucosamine deacetylase [Desulfobotulus sp. H1]|uniref:UDP-3-O-acyl-N-acetylglucosamine deacetylase n=1 Tax=Desulfobotulus pelophilus TaxID=2823377 RepID=A0ABT3NC09_9BACT|nr:UDP-3-O-acyl-N-acetylglucosamine deacetylase [Desulfobotulus pelophilus]MCW7754999.1 UDP-3-O-acyl-N-acetylglucosamine deacetylase [Desulfobotulus pelophilus]